MSKMQPSPDLTDDLATSLTVHIIEDDTDLREALGSLLASVNLQHLRYDSPVSFLDSLPLSGGGCLVIDIRMPGMSGIDLVKEIRRRKLPLPIIIMTAHADVPLTIQAFKLGAVEFLQKPFSTVAFLEAVRNALDLDRERLQHLAAAESLQSRMEQLTAKDWEVIDLMRKGYPNKRIAALLGISERAVEMRRSSLLKKLRVNAASEVIELVTRYELKT